LRYWDASAIVPLLLTEQWSPAMRALLAEDGQVSTFWTTQVECASAISRRRREAKIDRERAKLALDRLFRLRSSWSEVQPGGTLRGRAERLLRGHALRTLDSFHLAAALVASQEKPSTLPFVCLDSRLREAADREGFPLSPNEL
jgi:predicted nucleic acid-binding protein